jgi:hypothetical protein
MRDRKREITRGDFLKISTQIAAIGAPGSIDPNMLSAEFNACIILKIGFHKIKYLVTPV